MTEHEVFEILKQYKQDHILDYYCQLYTDKRNNLLGKISQLDIHLAFKLHEYFSDNSKEQSHPYNIAPSDIITIPVTGDEKKRQGTARTMGESLLRQGKVAVLIVSGGQGSRLGHDGPKGVFPVSPVRKKTLFQLFCEQIKALTIRYSTVIPLLIMTSFENHDDTIIYFQSNNYFGLHSETVHFFQQAMLPTLTPDGKLIAITDGSILTNPDGHGGSLKALHHSGLLSKLLENGYTELFYCQVDNPLVKIADPVFLGLHVMMKSEASTKVVRRKDIFEKVGLYISLDGKDAIVEYSDIGAAYMSMLDNGGNILYWAGNTAIHAFSLDFLQRITGKGFALPYHCAKKVTGYIDQTGKPVAADVWKFETFVFDAIPFAEKTCCMEVIREEEFAPVKNKEGNDSPETAGRAMVSLHTNWLQDAGINVNPGVKIEISPLFALDKEELTRKLKDNPISVNDDLYFE